MKQVFVGLLDIGRDMICWSRHISVKGYRAHIVRKNQKKLCFEKVSLRVRKRQEISLKIGERKSLKFSSYLQMTAFEHIRNLYTSHTHTKQASQFLFA